jgi:DNA-binding response OmpR family regulator
MGAGLDGEKLRSARRRPPYENTLRNWREEADVTGSDAASALSVYYDERDESISVGDLCVFPDQFTATLKGERLRLTRKEFLLLVLFARNPGRLLRRDRIAAEVWGGHAKGRTIDIHVARLRAKLPPGSISTVIRVGYRFTL